MACEIYTIGHSTQPATAFIEHLRRHDVTAIADVRSFPYSRHNPQFNKVELLAVLKAKGIRYVFLGKELGARSDDECCYVDDKVQYERLARTEAFRSGIARVVEGSRMHRIALMCAEKEPLDCHRTILVARELVGIGCQVQHILMDGSIESHEITMERLVKRLGIDGTDMFRTRDRAIAEAYEKQGKMIAYDRKAHRSIVTEEAVRSVIEDGHL